MAESQPQTRQSRIQDRVPTFSTRHATGLNISIFILILGVLASPAWAAPCQSAVSGSYEFAALGRGIDADGLRNSTEFAFAGVMSFESGGTVTRFFTISSGGTVVTVKATDPGSSGTWTADDSNCSGTISFPNTAVGAEKYRMYFTRDGKSICFVNSATGVVLSGYMEHQ